jgi:hypothetical protein
MKKLFYTWDGDALMPGILGTPNAKRYDVKTLEHEQYLILN